MPRWSMVMMTMRHGCSPKQATTTFCLAKRAHFSGYVHRAPWEGRLGCDARKMYLCILAASLLS